MWPTTVPIVQWSPCGPPPTTVPIVQWSPCGPPPTTVPIVQWSPCGPPLAMTTVFMFSIQLTCSVAVLGGGRVWPTWGRIEMHQQRRRRTQLWGQTNNKIWGVYRHLWAELQILQDFYKMRRRFLSDECIAYYYRYESWTGSRKMVDPTCDWSHKSDRTADLITQKILQECKPKPTISWPDQRVYSIREWLWGNALVTVSMLLVMLLRTYWKACKYLIIIIIIIIITRFKCFCSQNRKILLFPWVPWPRVEKC